jgi:beta-glucanase (GH16 family)
LILLELFSSQHCFCEAGWIDHDTPQDARTAWPFKVVPAPPSPTARGKKSAQDDDTEDKDEDDAKTTVTSHNRRKRVPTQTPSFEPTFPPTETPSVSPTSFTPAPTLPKRIYDLVFSDEFNVPHRKFGDGSDPRWTALEKNDYTNDAQHYYSADNAYTDTDGNLVIKTEAADTEVVGFNDVKFKNERITKHFKSAMLQSWNKFCFTGGIMEAEMALPGRHDVGGLWPAFWLLGNLARHTYVGSSEHVWPWSSTVCTDKSRTAQLISACDRVEHYGLHTGVGRGSPEIDVFEVQAGNIKANTGNFIKMPVGQPFMSTSYQVAPGRLWRPGEGWWPSPGQWYNNLTGGANTSMNIIFYGTYNHFRDDTNPAAQDYWSDAISFNRQLNASHFGNFHRYRVEWEVPEEASEKNNFTKNHGYIRWFLDGEFVLEVNGEGLSSSGTGGEISSEPMYMLLNTAISTQWGK